MSPSTLANAFPRDAPDTALIVPGSPALHVSFQKLSADVKAFQQQLASAGIAAGAAVSISLPNTYEFIVSFIAATWQRAIAAPLNPNYKQSEFDFYIDDLKSAIALVPQGAVAHDTAAVRAARAHTAAIAECYYNGSQVVLDIKENGNLSGKSSELLSPQPDDVALVLHTSGTTGRPKAVPLTHRNLLRTMKNVQATYQLSPNDRTLLVMPLFHVHGLLAGFLSPLASGGSVIVPPRFSATVFWKDFVEHKANWYTAVPTIHQILLKNPIPNPIPEIRFIRSCSSPLSPNVFHQLEKALGAPVLEAYAMTEAAHQMTSNPLPSVGPRKPGSVGLGQGVEIRVLDHAGNEVEKGTVGEICVRGENVTPGYLNNPAANASSFTKDGFFRTGDQGTQDAAGYISLTGRIKELINKGGEKISPIELDHIIAQNSAVSEAVTFAIEDDMYGQDVGLAIVIKDGHKLSAGELQMWLKERIAQFKMPKKIFFSDTMPKTATGKVQRRLVAEAMLKKEQPRAKL